MFNALPPDTRAAAEHTETHTGSLILLVAPALGAELNWAELHSKKMK
jgi:hypothetical protein